MSEEKEEVILRTYNSLWKIDRKIYHIENLKLLFPVSINDGLYFIFSFGISVLASKIIPGYEKLHFIIRYGIIPYALMKILTKQKLDGKYPHKFFYDYIVYCIEPKKYERFKPIDEIKKVKFGSPIIYRTILIFNKTEEILKNNRGRKNKDV